jgi:hypothetical protein
MFWELALLLYSGEMTYSVGSDTRGQSQSPRSRWEWVRKDVTQEEGRKWEETEEELQKQRNRWKGLAVK